MICKYCNEPITSILTGLRDFCSSECKKAHRRASQATLMRKRRLVSKRDGHVDINPLNVSKSEPYAEPIYEGQKGSLRPSEDFNNYGGKEWYHLAKNHCCNFEVRQREGYCVTLVRPIKSFKAKCCDCELGKALKSYNDKTPKNKRGKTFKKYVFKEFNNKMREEAF